MKYIITSSPLYDECNRVIPDNGFIDLLKELLPERIRALYAASVPDERALTQEFGDRIKESFENEGFRFESWEILDRLSDARAEELIAASDWIILAGGHVPTQNAYFREIGLREKLQGFEGLIMGISAGSMNMADTVYAEPEYPEEEADPGYVRWLRGLGITGLNIMPHYNLNSGELLNGRSIYTDIGCQDSLDLPQSLRNGFKGFFVLPDGSFILGEQKSAQKGSQGPSEGSERTERLFGEAWIIKNGRMEPLSDTGDIIRL